MRSRSSRLFVVLLHLVGVSTNLPRNSFLAAFFPNGLPSGIVGVNPMTILLEPLELKAAGGLEKLLEIFEAAGHDIDETFLNEPYWLQDDQDGKCLGPAGFSDCGDTTLWLIKRRRLISFPSTDSAKKSENNGGFLSIFQSRKHRTGGGDNKITLEWKYALQLLDLNTLPHIKLNNEYTTEKDKLQKEQSSEYECMISSPEDGSISLGPCSSTQAWYWRINKDGILMWNNKSKNRKHLKRQRSRSGKRSVLIGGPIARAMQVVSKKRDTPSAKEISQTILTQNGASKSSETLKEVKCVQRVNSSFVVTALCREIWPETNITSSKPTSTCTRSSSEFSTPSDHDDCSIQPVGFSLVRYQTTAGISPKLPPSFYASDESKRQEQELLKDGEPPNNSETPSLTKTKRPNLDNESGTKIEYDHLPRATRSSQSQANSPMSHSELKESLHLVFPDLGHYEGSKRSPRKKKSKTSLELQGHHLPLSGEFASSNMDIYGPANSIKSKGKLLHRPYIPHAPGSFSPMHDDTPHKPRKIPTHPYIEASKDGVWEDPQTGMKYLTDLSEYLGNERKSLGRHTLMGVGLYVRTMLKIKIYGVALYVTKRQVLRDKGFEQFAMMSAEQLRNNEGFYKHLMSDRSEGSFDRTILVKLNMQLSTDTIRSSLEADWKFLTPDQKELIINSSLRKREAHKEMVDTILSSDNPSRCSCSQTSLEEHKANPSCCARGTEMAFTWRRNGDLEVRINGRLMDTFPYPEMAKGIFFEYLRFDDPISVMARDNFAKGFPFLLASLAPMKDILSHANNQEPVIDEIPEMDSITIMSLGSLFQTMNSQASEASSWLQNNIEVTLSSMIRNTQHVGGSVEKGLTWTWEQMKSFQKESTYSVLSQLIFKRKEDSLSVAQIPNNNMKVSRTRRQSQISDEIGVIVEPTITFSHNLFLAMVHFYLMLLLIVSIPDSSNKRLIVKSTSTASTISSDSENEEENEEECNDIDSMDCFNRDDSSHYSYLIQPSAQWCEGEKSHTELTNLTAIPSPERGNHNHRNKKEMKKALSYYL